MQHYKLLSLTFFLLSTVITNNAFAKKAKTGPVIENYGPAYKVKTKDIALPEHFKYKVVFDVYKTASEVSNHSRRIESVARFINMHALNGVKMEDMEIAVVFHGKATKDILNDNTYEEKYLSTNPNKEMIQDLADKGVKFYVCGQTVEYYDYTRANILPDIKVSLSAMTQLVVLQSQGYSLLP